ncbi:MAG: methyltransferase family protein [Pikeienuella sp.]
MHLLKTLDLPPVWLVLFMGLAWFMAEVWAPLGDALLWPGRVLILAGLAVAVWAVFTLHRGGTTVIPHQEPGALVTAGPFAWSRNPIYVADLAILAGWCLTLGTVAGLVLLGGLYVVLESRFIRPEERRLAAAFGDDFAAYAARVRRWV